MASASPDTIAIADHEAQAVASTALNFVSRFQAATRAN
jgi:hypothetical protein